MKDDATIENLIKSSIVSKIKLSKPWPDEEEMYTPIDIHLAREMLTNVINQGFNDQQGWIFILCSENSDFGTEVKGTFLLSTYIKRNSQFSRGIGSYNGVVKHGDKSMDSLLKCHYSMISPSAKLNTQLESYFEITPDMTLKFINNTVAPNPSLRHIDDTSDVILYQKVQIGKGHLLCEDFWSQIQLLNMIKFDILNHKNLSIDGSMSEPAYNYGSADMSFENLQDKINKILSEVVAMSEGEDANADTGLESVIKRARYRSLPDITDQLWDLLKFTRSYSDLKKAFTFVFQISSRSNIVNVPTNNNRLSELIRELCQQRLAIPHLVGTEPLELLLEIGMEKIMKDFEFILSEGKICKLSNFTFKGKTEVKGDSRLSVRKLLSASITETAQPRKTLLKAVASNDSNEEEEFGIRNSRFVEREVESSISKLAQIYLAIEHLLLIQNNLSMDSEFATITRKLFEKELPSIDELQYPMYDHFEIQIHDRKIIHLIDNMIPTTQKITLQSSNKFKDITNVFYYNIEQIVPSLVKQEKESEAVDKSCEAFHCIRYTTIASNY